jgi:polyisoprenoid-binding protein YceI
MIPTHHLHRSRLKTAAVAAFAGFALTAGTFGATFAQDASPSAATCNVEQAVADAPLAYTVDGTQSVASYTVTEELASIGENEVVGTTNAILGSILLDEDGTPLMCSNFAVDMRTLVTDENRRDNYLRENTLESDTFPFATFVVASVDGLDGPIEDGATVTATLTGDFSLHGVTQTVSWDAEITRDGETLTGTADYTFLIADYEMEKPIVGPVVSIDDEVTLSVDIVATLEG